MPLASKVGQLRRRDIVRRFDLEAGLTSTVCARLVQDIAFRQQVVQLIIDQADNRHLANELARHLGLGGVERFDDLARPGADGSTPSEVDDKGQEAGYMSDPKVRRAVELQAVSQAVNYYESLGYHCEDVGAFRPFDLLLSGTGSLPAERHVEVKGSSGSALKVELTHGEVEHARRFQPTDLFVVSGIEWELSGDSVMTRPGSPRLIAEWIPRDDDLLAVRFRLTVPVAETLPVMGHKGAAT